MSRINFILCVSVFTLLSSNVFSQDVEGTILAFNEVVSPAYVVSVKGNTLIIEGFREGEQVKVDRVNIFDLDLQTLKISDQDGTVSVNCFSDAEGCVARTLTRERKKKTYRNRVVFEIPEGESGAKIADALGKLLTRLKEKN